MQSAVEADLSQLGCCSRSAAGSIPAIDTTEIVKEIGARMREELDYRREAKHVALYRPCSTGEDIVRVPHAWPELSTGRLLTLDWLEGDALLGTRTMRLRCANAGQAMFTAWWKPFSRFGVIHGDPHLGNYTVFTEKAASRPASICSTTAASASSRRDSSAAWSISTRPLHDDDERIVHAYETWGFRGIARVDRHAQHLGALHLRPADGRPRAHHRRRRDAGRIRPPRGLPGA